MQRVGANEPYVGERPAPPALPFMPRGAGSQRRRQRLVVLALSLSDVLLATLIWHAASLVQDIWGHGPLSGVAAFSVVPNVAVWVGLRALLGLYPGYGLDSAEELRRQTYAVASTLGITTVFALALHVGDLLSRLLMFVGFLGLAFLAPLARHLVKRALMRLGSWGKPVVVLGAGATGAHMVKALRDDRGLGFVPVAVFDDYLLEPEVMGNVPCSTLDEADDVARENGIDTAVVAMPRTRRARFGEIVDWASTRFRRVIVVPELPGQASNSAMVARDLAGTFGVEIKQNLLNPWSQRAKRVLDLLGAGVGGLLVSPLLLATVLLIRLDSPGPAIYGQERVGTGGHAFRCWKFRTMCVAAEEALNERLQEDPTLRAEWERDQKLRDDPRVTRIGRFLRETSLDELPQIWNVLKGEMSLVGPRPIVEAEIPRYGSMYSLYTRVRPGISGLWQVGGRSDTGYAERVSLDAYYVRNWSVWLDLVVLGRTIATVASRRGAR